MAIALHNTASTVHFPVTAEVTSMVEESLPHTQHQHPPRDQRVTDECNLIRRRAITYKPIQTYVLKTHTKPHHEMTT